MVRLTIACLSACFVSSVRGQNYSPIVDDRVETDVVDVPVISQEVEHRGGLELGAVISTAYDSNIFLSKKDPTPDSVTRIGPAVSYTQGDAKEGEGGFIKFAYQPTGVIYAEHGSDNRIDQQAALTAGWRGKTSSVTYVGAARKLGDATADTGQQTDRIEFENEVIAAWMPREKITVELAAGNSKSDYADPTLYDSHEAYGRLGVRYAYSPKTEVGMAYQVGRLVVDGGSDQTLQQVTVNFAWQPREKIKIALQAGAEHRDAKDGSEVNPVLESRIDWTPRQGTNLFLAGYQRQEASAFYAGQDYSVLGATAGISQRLGGNWTARLEAGREKVAYSRVSGSGASGRKDAIWFVRPALEYKLTDAVDVSFFYRISNDSSTAREFGYRQQLAGIELTYKF
ncbi:MAG: hypothetical protein ABIS50_03490 [Luteolibacter sp.]|uniref:hypothetical protein n=1 Tax=Luteolibacter sp. TaxID=1962973 RepID=UPI00326775AF